MLLIGRSSNARYFANLKIPLYCYCLQQMGWIDGSLLTEWVKDMVMKLKVQDRKTAQTSSTALLNPASVTCKQLS